MDNNFNRQIVLYSLLGFILIILICIYFRHPIASLCNSLLIVSGEMTIHPESEKKAETKKSVPQTERVTVEGVVQIKRAEPVRIFTKWDEKTPVLMESKSDFELTKESFIRNFAILGLFPTAELIKENKIKIQTALDYSFMENETKIDCSTPAPEGIKWQYTASTLQDGKFDFNALFGGDAKTSGHALYAIAILKTENEYDDAVFYIGCDDAMRIWLNGSEVFSHKSDSPNGRGTRIDAQKETVNLLKGENILLLKTVNYKGSWDMFLRFTEKNGKMLFFKP